MELAQRRLIIWGAGGHAKVVADVARALGYQIVGYLDETATRHGEFFYGATILGGSDWLNSPDAHHNIEVFVAIGHNPSRERCLQRAIDEGLTVSTLIHPLAVVSPSVELGRGTVVMAGAIVQAATSIEMGGIINTGASVDHDCRLGSCVHIAPGARLTGQVSVGDHTLVGVGAVVIPRTHIGQRCTVGAGAAVINNVADDQTVVGVPARVMSQA